MANQGLDGFRLLRATMRFEMHLWSAAEEATVAACDLKLGSVMMLHEIGVAGDSTRVQDLAQAMGITVGAVSKIVDRLEAAGLVARTPSATDGRSSVISRTALGKAVTKSAMRAISKAMPGALGEHAADAAISRWTEFAEAVLVSAQA